MTNLTLVPDLLAAGGLAAVTAGAFAAARFAARPIVAARLHPPVTILKPLCGDEPGLEAALASICAQDYPVFQLVLGVGTHDDPALETVRRIRARFPGHAIDIVVAPAPPGANRKIANLLTMMPAARHDVLVFSDSDLHVAPDYVAHIVAALERPGTGLVTTVCVGLPTARGWVAKLGATAISHSFLPSVFLSRALGRADCLGTTMALRRDTLGRVGGLQALLAHLGDDNVLGRRVRELGLDVALAATVPRTAVPETSIRDLWQHELRWARTIRALEPFLFATSIIQYPLFWATLAVCLSGCSLLSVVLFAAGWMTRAAAARATDRLFHTGRSSPLWLLPARDIMSATVVLASYCGARVVWRGNVLRATGYRPRTASTGPNSAASSAALSLETFP